MQRFDSLAHLLDAYCRFRPLTVGDLADAAGCSARTIQRWRRHPECAKDAALLGIAHRFMLSFDALVHLRSGMPIWYDFRSLRFSYSPFDLDVINAYVLRHGELFSPQASALLDPGVVRPMQPGDLRPVMKVEQQIYDMPPRALELLTAAIRLAPQFNLVARSSRGSLEGHLICLPVDVDTYRQMRVRRMPEARLTPRNLVPIDDPKLGTLQVYALYAGEITYRYYLVRAFLDRVMAHWNKVAIAKTRVALSWYAVTPEERELADKLGLLPVGQPAGDPGIRRALVSPAYFTASLSALSWLEQSRGLARLGDRSDMEALQLEL